MNSITSQFRIPKRKTNSSLFIFTVSIVENSDPDGNAVGNKSNFMRLPPLNIILALAFCILIASLLNHKKKIHQKENHKKSGILSQLRQNHSY